MKYRHIAPGPKAAHIVDHYWTLETDDAGAVQRVVPDGSPELIVHLGTPFEACVDGGWQAQPRSFIAGQLTRPLLLRSAGPAKILGVNFRPHGLAAWLGPRVQDVTDRFLPVDGVGDLCEDNLREFEERLLRKAAPPDALIEHVVGRLEDAPDIARLARELGISTRQLERRFSDRVGVTPKLFARMRRFQRVFAAAEHGTWASVAVACGYYDQAHLIRDFHQFAGDAPTSIAASDDLARHFLSHFSKTRR